MTTKTLSDCAKCRMIRFCTAHITGGTWPHDRGVNPCIVITDCPEDGAKHDCEGCRNPDKCREEDARKGKI